MLRFLVWGAVAIFLYVGGADVCIDAVGCEASGSAAQTLTGRYMKLQAGSATALHWAINSVRNGGNVSIVGVYGPTFNAVPIGNALDKGVNTTTIFLRHSLAPPAT